LLFEALAARCFDWNKIHLFWVDERAVPPSDPQSNYRLAAEALLMPAKFPPRNVHRIRGEFRPEVAARCYATEIRDFFGLEEGEMPHFDVIHQGIGADAHTASLFPGEPLLEDREGIAAAVFVEKLAQWRITLLPGVLLAARHTVLLATGADKAEAVRAVFHEPYDPKRYPAQMAPHQGRGVAWFLDQAAARLVGD
jgi:6-phosphogluconolactonase